MWTSPTPICRARSRRLAGPPTRIVLAAPASWAYIAAASPTDRSLDDDGLADPDANDLQHAVNGRRPGAPQRDRLQREMPAGSLKTAEPGCR